MRSKPKCRAAGWSRRSTRPPSLSGDFELLQRACDNVLRNAIRHAPKGTSVAVELSSPRPTAPPSRSGTTVPACPPMPCPRSSSRSTASRPTAAARAAAWAWAWPSPAGPSSSTRARSPPRMPTPGFWSRSSCRWMAEHGADAAQLRNGPPCPSRDRRGRVEGGNARTRAVAGCSSATRLESRARRHGRSWLRFQPSWILLGYENGIPPLEAGDRLTRVEFERRYQRHAGSEKSRAPRRGRLHAFTGSASPARTASRPLARLARPTTRRPLRTSSSQTTPAPGSTWTTSLSRTRSCSWIRPRAVRPASRPTTTSRVRPSSWPRSLRAASATTST